MRSESGAAPVHRLMIASECRMTGSVVEQLLGLRAEICRFNASRGVRTAIWYSAGWFLQWHEGPLAAIDQVWTLSAAHPGHSGQRLIHRSQGPAGLAGRLHLSTAHNRDTPADVARRIHRMERERELGWTAEPLEIWQHLSAPCLAQELGAVAAVARGHVVAVTSESTESVDLVKAIAERRRADVTYQRFADGDLRSGDIGAAYVDVADGGQMTRVQALSRRALANGMVRVGLQRTQCLVLLLGDRPGAAAKLAGSVAELLAEMDVRPAVRLLGPSGDACGEAGSALARLQGLDIAARKAGTPGHSLVDALLDVVGDFQQAAHQAAERGVTQD